MKLSPSKVYQLLIDAGFTPAAATTMTAIAGAESRYDTTAHGDIQLQTGKWGESFGLFQIRTLKADTGRGTVRDLAWLADPAHQAKAAFEISNGGRDFTPWSVFTTGTFRQYLGKLGDTNGGPIPTPNADDFTPDSGGINGWKAVLLESLFVVAGLGVIVFGIRRFGGIGK